MCAVSFADENDVSYFGPSSNIAFLKTIAEVMFQESSVALRSPVELFTNAPSGVSNARPVEQEASLSLQEPALNTSREASYDRSLLATNEGMQLVEKFFYNTGYLFPYLHEGLFKERYRSMLESPQRPSTRSWLALLHMLFAMSSSTSLDEGFGPSHRRERSDACAQKALGFLGPQLMRGANLEHGKPPTFSKSAINNVRTLSSRTELTANMRSSAFPSPLGPVSSGYSKAFRGLGCPRIDCQGRFPTRSPRSIKIH